MADVVVIGGGLAGLACGVALADRGLAVTVVEAGELGGRARSWRDAATGDTVDIGPHVFHSEYQHMLGFLERLGTRERICWQPDPVMTIASEPPLALKHRRWLPAPMTLMPSLLSAPGLRLPDYLSMWRVALEGMTFGEERVAQLDAVSALDYLRAQGVSERMIDWWWRFAAMVVTNVPLERCSAASLLRIHAQLSGYRLLHFGMARDGLSDLYCAQAAEVIRAAGGEVVTGTAVETIAGALAIEGVVLADGRRIAARQVVSAVPPDVLARLWPQSWRALAPQGLARFEPSPYVSCYLWFDRPVAMPRFVAHLWTPTRLNYDFYDLTQIRDGWRGRPTIVASNIIYSHRAHGLSDGEIIEATLREMAQFAPQTATARLVHADLHRIPMAIPCPTVGFETMRPPSVTAVPGLVLAGDWTATEMPCTMEGAVKSGLAAAEAVLAERGTPAQLVRPARLYDGFAGMTRKLIRAVRKDAGSPG